jgi:hypothetical protein
MNDRVDLREDTYSWLYSGIVSGFNDLVSSCPSVESLIESDGIVSDVLSNAGIVGIQRDVIVSEMSSLGTDFTLVSQGRIYEPRSSFYENCIDYRYNSSMVDSYAPVVRFYQKPGISIFRRVYCYIREDGILLEAKAKYPYYNFSSDNGSISKLLFGNSSLVGPVSYIYKRQRDRGVGLYQYVFNMNDVWYNISLFMNASNDVITRVEFFMNDDDDENPLNIVEFYDKFQLGKRVDGYMVKLGLL